MLLAFAGTHLFHSLITNAYVQGKYRHSFWNEIYETSLAFHLLIPTLKTLIAPRSGGGFNVTAKGGLVEPDGRLARLVRIQIHDGQHGVGVPLASLGETDQIRLVDVMEA